jgi:hypothetical protein
MYLLTEIFQDFATGAAWTESHFFSHAHNLFNGSVDSRINFHCIYFHQKMVVRSKHVAAKLNKPVKTIDIELLRQKSLTLISYTQQDANTRVNYFTEIFSSLQRQHEMYGDKSYTYRWSKDYDARRCLLHNEKTANDILLGLSVLLSEPWATSPVLKPHYVMTLYSLLFGSHHLMLSGGFLYMTAEHGVLNRKPKVDNIIKNLKQYMFWRI